MNEDDENQQIINFVKQCSATQRLRQLLITPSQEFVNELYQHLDEHIRDDLQINVTSFRQKD